MAPIFFLIFKSSTTIGRKVTNGVSKCREREGILQCLESPTVFLRFFCVIPSLQQSTTANLMKICCSKSLIELIIQCFEDMVEFKTVMGSK